jgi:hypothetical protein
MAKETQSEIDKAEAKQDRADARAEARAEDRREVRAQVKADAEAATQEVYDRVAPISADPAPIQRDGWEYLTVVCSEQADLNPYGLDGWELVSIAIHGQIGAIYYFKRPKA